MKKYRAVVSYVGAIGIDVEAENEKKAAEKAERLCSEMPDNVFYYECDVQYEETYVEEIE